MKNELLFHFLGDEKYRPLLIGIGIACLHSVLTYITAPLLDNDFNLRSIAYLPLIMPSYILLLLVHSDPPVDFPVLEMLSSSLVFMIVFSSFVYGTIGGLVTSKQVASRWTGIVLVGLFILLSCYVLHGLVYVYMFSSWGGD
ncbi:hypothetical protein ANAEL_05213 [Anaerolineales bacterium]|nr:hypothetical protein ANAEL_05213 [Anaerolineales bacterium]